MKQREPNWSAIDWSEPKPRKAIRLARSMPSLEELKQLPETATGPALYFLWRADELLYIGASKKVEKRLSHHSFSRSAGPEHGTYTTRVPFERVTILACAVDELFAFEADCIGHYRPPYNKQSKPEML